MLTFLYKQAKPRFPPNPNNHALYCTLTCLALLSMPRRSQNQHTPFSLHTTMNFVLLGTPSRAYSRFSCTSLQAVPPPPQRSNCGVCAHPAFTFFQVGRYYTTQKYANHWDAFDFGTEDGWRFAQNGGQRVCTVLVYLNDVVFGGCTSFPRLGLRVQPKKGIMDAFNCLVILHVDMLTY